MQGGDIHKLIAIFYASLDRMEVMFDLAAIERFAVIVHKAMTIQTRHYHNLDHVFEFVEPSDPIRTLAALYHDLVYYQVDRGFLPEIRAMISKYVYEADGQISLKEAMNRPFLIAMKIFGFEPGHELSTSNGLNEFLSAMVAYEHLNPFVSERDWLEIVVCIEATIPFRDGDHFYKLEERLQKVCDQYSIQISSDEIETSIKRAVVFANKDVESFSEKDVGKFLESTWRLLPEANMALRSRDLYTIREYRQALFNTETFLRSLNPDNIFHAYRGVPPDVEFEKTTHRARNNLVTAIQYLEIKLLTQAVLEALAELTGGDAPLALFMGDMPDNNDRTLRLEDLLPQWPDPHWVDTNAPAYHLLIKGREGENSFDLNTSPLSLFIYKNLAPHRLGQLTKLAKEMFNGAISAQTFVNKFDRAIISGVASAIAAMVLTRRDALLKFSASSADFSQGR